MDLLGSRPSRGAVGLHVGVADAERRDGRLLDRARRRPAHEVVRPAGLVVRARGAAAAERLLGDDGAGGLVVDVEVARRVAQLVVRERDRRAVAREDRAGQRVGRGAVAQLERLGVARLGVRVDREARARTARAPWCRSAGRSSR